MLRSRFGILVSGIAVSLVQTAQAATPIAAYGFEDGSGTTLTDRSGNARHGTLRNGPVWSTGKYGGGLTFDGSNDYVRIGDVEAADGLTAFTVSAWVKFAAAGGGSRETHLVDKSNCTGYTNNGPWELAVSLTNPHKAELLIYPQNGQPSAYLFSGASTTTVDDGNWHHITGRYDGTNLSIWVDGVQENSFRAPGLRVPNTTYAVELGGNCNGYAYPFRGSLDDVRFYATALTQTEIQTDMVTSIGGSGGTPPPPPPPPPQTDTTAPSRPSGLAITNVTTSQVSLSWRASTDNVGVTGYRVYRGGTQVGTTTSLAFTDTGLTPNTSYAYTVYAHDAAGNRSSASASRSATTAAVSNPPPTNPNPPSGTYTTNFDQSENPLSENGRWRRANNAWTNVQTLGGVAYGTNGVTNGYDDSYSLLSGFGPNQSGEATVYRNTSYPPNDPHEVEILLRFSDDSSNARGYECLFNVRGGVDLIRWNGAMGNYANLSLSETGWFGRELVTGDKVKCTIVGSTITAYINGQLMARASDSAITSGQPGIGFFVRQGSPLLLGLTSYTASQL